MNTRKLEAINEIIIHCAATRPSMDIGVETIRKWHLDRGFSDVGYHFVIRRSGEVEFGRQMKFAGAHTKGKNSYSIGICMVGGVSEDDVNKAENNFTREQFQSLFDLVKDLKESYKIKKVSGHYQYATKDCPSFDVQDWQKTVGI